MNYVCLVSVVLWYFLIGPLANISSSITGTDTQNVIQKNACSGFCRCFSCSLFFAGPFLCTLFVVLYALCGSGGGAMAPVSVCLYVSIGWQIVVRDGIRL